MVQTQFLWCYGGSQVFLYDSFSGWTEQVPMTLVEGSSKIFQAFRDLPPGCHQYKFLVDNIWRIDDQQPCLQDNTYGTINNFILVPEQEFILPIVEAFPPTMDIDNNGIPQPVASSSGSLHQGPVLSLSANEMDVSRLRLSMHMSFYKTYELIPNSGEVFALDVNVDVEDAFHVMYEKGLAVVPLWDEPSRQISGMLTASDFIFILIKLHKSRAVLTNEMLEIHTISALKEGKLQLRREGAGSSSLAYRPLIQAGPDESLQDLALRIVKYRISAVPILDAMEDGSCPQLLHIACLAGILKHICRHFRHHLEYLPLLQQPVGSLRLGTWRTNEGSSGPLLLTLHPSELLGSALNLLIEARISAIPIVDDEGALMNVLTRSDITTLAKGSVYAQIQLDGTTIIQALALVYSETHNRYQICRRSDSLYTVMELLSDPVVRRIIVMDSDRQHVEGIITLRDLIEKQRLIEFAESLRSKLNYFDELENVANSFYSPTMNVANGNFLPLLKRLDECISYVESNPQYAESSVYLVKFRQLQSRALGMIRSHILSVLKSTTSQVQAAMLSSGSNKATVSEGVEASIIYVRFKAAASELKPVLEEIESRSQRKEYVQILADCHKLYCEHRLSLIRDIVHQRISIFAKKEALPSLTRSGCAYLMQVCQLEHQLFDHFFPSSSEDISSLAPLIDPLCTYLYDTLRPKLIHETNIDTLCELVDILKVEVLGEQLSRRTESLAGLRPTLDRILADVHERLTFRARTHIRNEIANYIPFDEDLDYPAKLEQSAEVKSEISSDDQSPDVSKMWYPPLEKTLSCLSKLYHCLEQEVFTGLAQEAVEVCSSSIQKASKLIVKRSSPMDGQLFLIKHLLILREQIAPFDIEFSVTHKELDFSHLLDHLRRILRGQASLFDWSRSTSLARTLSPRVLESQIDAKKELEKSLKATCEEFIMSVTKLVVDPMLSFVTKVTAVRVALSSGTQNPKLDSVMAKPLKDQAFATPDMVAEIVKKVSAAVQQELPRVMAKMKLYLQNSSTRTILFKPIKTNIVEAHIQVQSLLKSEYSSEEVKSIIDMVSIQDLQAQLDNLL